MADIRRLTKVSGPSGRQGGHLRAVLVTLALVLTGCGNSAGPETDAVSEASTTAQTQQLTLGAQASYQEFNGAGRDASLLAARIGLIVTMEANGVTRHPSASEVERFHGAVMVKCAGEPTQLMRQAMARAVLDDPSLIPY